MWEKSICKEPNWRYTVISNSYIVEMTGGSVCIKEKSTGAMLKNFKGLNYVYTGDIKPDESECFALENGKHFYVCSLKTFELIKKVTLPRFYESIDVIGFYSEDGELLNIPVYRWVSEAKEKKDYFNIGHHQYAMCKYETKNYTLVKIVAVDNLDNHMWDEKFKITIN